MRDVLSCHQKWWQHFFLSSSLSLHPPPFPPQFFPKCSDARGWKDFASKEQHVSLEWQIPDCCSKALFTANSKALTSLISPLREEGSMLLLLLSLCTAHLMGTHIILLSSFRIHLGPVLNSLFRLNPYWGLLKPISFKRFTPPVFQWCVKCILLFVS